MSSYLLQCVLALTVYSMSRIVGGGTRNIFLNWKIFASVDDDISDFEFTTTTKIVISYM